MLIVLTLSAAVVLLLAAGAVFVLMSLLPIAVPLEPVIALLAWAAGLGSADPNPGQP